MQTRIHFGSVGNPFFATKLGDIEIVKQNLLPEVQKKFKNAKIIKVKVHHYELIDLD